MNSSSFFFFFDFCGRENELEQLNKLYNKNGFKFAVVYGRRRVGKSSLIQEFINDGKKENISFMGIEQGNVDNLRDFSQVVLNKFSKAKGYINVFDTWNIAFDYIIEEANGEKLVLFIDEFPYLANSNSAISSILQNYIDGKFKATNIMLVLCGSSLSFMENQVLGHESPLYGRRDMQFKIEPFDYLDTGKMCKNWNNFDKAITYGITSGVPHYINKLIEHETIEEGIKEEFLMKSGSLYEEPRNLLLQELREPSTYNTIIKAIANGSTKVNEISMKSKEENSKINKYLTTLMSLHIVKKEFPIITAKERNGLYELEDKMFMFWYRFVANNLNGILSGMTNNVYENIKKDLPDYMGKVFEDMSIQYLNRMNAKYQLPFVFNEIGRWWGNNPKLKQQEEIDIVAINDDSILYGECKWKDKLGTDVLDELIRKSEILDRRTNKYYVVFVKGAFSQGVIDRAKVDKNIILITLDDMYKI